MSIIVAFALASAVGAPDQPAATAPAVAEAPAKPVKDKKICKTDPNSDPGSHMVKRVCHTESEWHKQGLLESSRSGFSISGDKYGDH